MRHESAARGSLLPRTLLTAPTLSGVRTVPPQLAPGPSDGGNYLRIGSDTRACVNNPGDRAAFVTQTGNQGQRSDTMMILHAEPGAGRSLLVSIPRDLWVKIPGQGMAKNNDAFNTGPQKVVDTGYYWYDKSNMEDPKIAALLYK